MYVLQTGNEMEQEIRRSDRVKNVSGRKIFNEMMNCLFFPFSRTHIYMYTQLKLF